MARFDAVDGWMLALVLTWGTAFASLRILSTFLDPFQLTWYRYVPFLFFFGLWLIWKRRDRFGNVSGNEWLLISLAGPLAVVGYHFPLNWALDATQPNSITGGTAAILVATTPLWTTLMAVVAGQEKLNGGRVLGMAFAFGGVVLIVTRGQGQEVEIAAKAAIAILAPICWALYNILVKPMVHKHGGLFMTGITMCVGTAALLPLGIHYGIEPLRSLDARAWWWMLFLSLLATVAGYAIWNWALKRRLATELTSYIFAVPVMATIMSWILLGEAVNAWFGLGAALVLFGLWRVHNSRRTPVAADL